MQEQARNMDYYIQPERSELKKGGYFYEAKLIVLLNLWREKKGLPSLEEEEVMLAAIANEAEDRFSNVR